MYETCYGDQQKVPCWPPKIDVTEVSPMWAVCVPFCCIRADYCGYAGRWNWFLAQLVAKALLVDRASLP